MLVLKSIPAITRGLLALVLLAFTAASPGAESKSAREGDLKAAFLFNFALFVEWPAEAFPDETAPFVIGILGETPVANSLETIVTNETVHNRKIVVRRYRDLKEISGCHILYISPSESARVDRVLAEVKGKSILTVGESDNFCLRGGVIQFTVEENKLHLKINRRTGQTAGLTISSKLLSRAEIIEETQAR